MWTRFFGKKAPATLAEKSDDTVANRRIRVFVSSTFRDMIEERDALMTHTWPALRRLCQERHVELVEVDLRWGIAESQATRKETLKLCLDEIRSCRPFFIGLLGERYGWTPSNDAFTADLQEEQPWLASMRGRSVTELEILHGVLNNPEMADRAFFYFRDPVYAQTRGPDFLSESESQRAKQLALKTLIRTTCTAMPIPLRENYPDPSQLATMVLADLSAAIETQFPKEDVPDPLTREAQDHEAFAETRRRAYIGRAEYVEALDCHALGDGGALLLVGDSGSGKSALLANWLEHWRKNHPKDFIVQHYIGGTADSADHWRLMSRLMAEIKRWSGDLEALPTNHDDIRKDFPLWLNKARTGAAHQGVRFILVLDALNQLDDQDHARLLGWLPEYPFTGPLRLIVSTLPGTSGAEDPLEAVQQRRWQKLRVQPLTVGERRQMIAGYLARFGKTLDEHQLARLASAAPAANPLYLKTLLDDLRVTGTYDRLDERLTEYLVASDIATLLQQVLARYQRDYELERPGLVGEALGLIYAARRGLSESELLHLLGPTDQIQLPPALWSPLRAALEGALIDRGGILNFAHDFLRTAVGSAFAAERTSRDALRLQLANYFEAQPITTRSCDELPWLLNQTVSFDRLRACLLDIDRFMLIHDRDKDELRSYWVKSLQEQQTMGRLYLTSFEHWSLLQDRPVGGIAYAANQLSLFHLDAALYPEAELLMRRALDILENIFGNDHPAILPELSNLAVLLQDTNRLGEAEPLMRRALDIVQHNYGNDNPRAAIALSNLAQLLRATNRLAEAEPLLRLALHISEGHFGPHHPDVALNLSNLAGLLQDTNRLGEAELLLRRALEIDEHNFGVDHLNVEITLSNLAQLLQYTNRLAEAEPLMRRALEIAEHSFGPDHPRVATELNNLAQLLQDTNRLTEAEPLQRRALEIVEHSFGPDHPRVAAVLGNLAQLLQGTNRLTEAEPLQRRALEIDEHSYGSGHPAVALQLNNLARLLQATNRLSEAEPLQRRALTIDEHTYGSDHPAVARDIHNLAQLLKDTDRLAEAEPLMRRSLAIAEQSFGQDHPKVAQHLNSLARLLRTTSRRAEAEMLMRRALDIHEHSLGQNHPMVAGDLNDLAQLLQNTDRFAEAEPLMRRSLEIDELGLGKDHPDVAIRLNNLAGLLQDANRLAEAEPLMRRSVEILMKVTRSTGQLHPHAQVFVNNYAGLVEAMGRSRAEITATVRRMAEPLLRSALEIAEHSFGPDHPDVATALDNLVGMLYETNQLAEAEPLMRRALEIEEHSLGSSHPNVAVKLRNLAGLLRATNRLDEAEPLLRRALDIDEHNFGKDHSNVAIDLNLLARLLRTTSRRAEAEPLLRRALNIAQSSFGKDEPAVVAAAYRNLAGLLQETNRPSEAEPLLRRALEIDEHSLGLDHPEVAIRLNNLAQLLQDMNRLAEAEPLLRRALEINEHRFGPDHPDVAIKLNKLGRLLLATNQFAEAEQVLRRGVEILMKIARSTKQPHPQAQTLVNDYAELLKAMGRSQEEISATVHKMVEC